MTKLQKKETETVKKGIDSDGAVVRERTSLVNTDGDSKITAVNIIWYAYGLIATLLGIRMLLKLFGANSANSFVDTIYSISGVLSAPFDSVFSVAKAEAGNVQSVFEPSILVAIAVYGLIAWGINRLILINEG